jgi:lipopolysaccharide export system permease protein
MLDIKALNRNLDTLHSKENVLKESICRIAKENFSIEAKDNGLEENFYSKLNSLPSERLRDIENITANKIEYVYNEMNGSILRLSSDSEMVRRHQIELHRKFTLSVACLILFFIGAPLGAIIRKGGMGMPIVVSALAFIIYYIVGTMGENAAIQEEIPIWVGMWLSTFVFLPIGLFLTAKATTDAGLLNAEVWSKYVNKFVNSIKKLYKKKK